MAKLKMTGFARLLIAMIFIVPLAYVGATFINGGEGLEDLKEMLGMETSQVEEKEVTELPVPAERAEIPPAATVPPPMEKAGQGEEAMNEMRDKLNEMYDENSALKEEILKLRKQLEAATKEVQ